jgi:predicted dehydrogenase
METVRIGVIGCGMVARIGHLPWAQRNPHCRITAVADPDPANLRSARKRYRVPLAYDDPMELLDSGQVDAVCVCSPNWAHTEQVLAAAQRRLHVLCEKPMATRLEDCESMCRACDEAGVVFQVAMQKRFHPAFERARNIVDAGGIGQVFQVSVQWSHYIPDLETPWIRAPLKVARRLGVDLEKRYGAWRLTDERSGGGDFLDHGPHYLDLFRFLAGDYDLISAEMKRVFPSRVHEDHALCTVRFASGALGHIERSQNVLSRPYGHELGQIHGTQGSLYFEVPHEYTLGHARLWRYRRRNTLLDRRTRIRLPEGKGWTSYGRQMDLFVARVLDGRSGSGGFPRAWAPGGTDGRVAVESVLAAYLSSRQQRKVTFPLSAGDRQAAEQAPTPGQGGMGTERAHEETRR